jgi:hypothetical protein
MKHVKILVVVTILFLGIFLMDTFGVFRAFMEMNEPNIRDAAEDLYPEYKDIDTELLDVCEICDESGCRTYPGPCWKITMIIEGEEGSTLVEMVMDAGGSVIDKKETACIWWWCEAEQCRYVYDEQTLDVLSEYTNMDCEDQEVCDSEYEACRSCLEGPECVGRIITASPSEITYTYEVLGTGEAAVIDNNELVCRIISRGNLLFEQAMDIGSCGDLIYDNTECYNGSCDFVPGFELIPMFT